MRGFLKRCSCLFLAVCLAFPLNTAVGAEEGETQDTGAEPSVWTADETTAVEAVPVAAEGAVELGEGDTAEWKVTLPQAGTYAVLLYYTAVENKGANIGFSFAVDGEYPYEEMQNLELNRLWRSVFLDESVEINQRKPEEEEVFEESRILLSDNSGKYNMPFSFSLSAGEHTLTMSVQTEKVSIRRIALAQTASVPTYAEYAAEHVGEQPASAPITFEAERASLKSNKSILPLNDRTSPKTTPYHHSNVIYNSIGGDSWGMPGQWIEWTVDVKEAGLYCLDFRFKQSYKLNAAVYRSLYIDGELPFVEAQELEFPYASGWQSLRLGDDSGSYQFYLSEGTHTIRLQVTTGRYAQIIEQVDALVDRLNRVYRQILVITGISPDMYRDYEFNKLIPDTLVEMAEISAALQSVIDQLDNLSEKSSGSDVSAIERLIRQLNNMSEDSTTIPKNFQNSDFQNNITSLASWMSDLRSQPLELDSAVLNPLEADIPAAGAGFLKTFSHYMIQFFYRFS